MINPYELIKAGVEPLYGLDFGRINYSQKEIAILVFAVLALSVLLKLFFSRNRSSQKHSGYFISSEYGVNPLYVSSNLLFKFVLLAGASFILIALAEPYLPYVRETTVIKESRERIDLIDVSSSKGWAYLNTGRAAGEIGREAFMEFLNMRRGKNDRTSLWLFSSHPYMLEDFIRDDNIYNMEAYDAPFTMVFSSHIALPENDPEDNYVDIIAPKDRIQILEGEAGTNLSLALDAVIEFLKYNGSKEIKQKGLLIETDAAVEQYPEIELKKLKAMNVNMYFLHIKPNEKAEMQYPNGPEGLKNAKKLKEQVLQYGGRFYDVTDKKSIIKAYEDIDKLEAEVFKSVSVTNKLPLFSMFLLAGIAAMFVAVFFILLSEIPGIYP